MDILEIGDRVTVIDGQYIGLVGFVRWKGVNQCLVESVNPDFVWYFEKKNLKILHTKKFIVCAIVNGTVRPSLRPFVHNTSEGAVTEAERLSVKENGTFEVFQAVCRVETTVVKTTTKNSLV